MNHWTKLDDPFVAILEPLIQSLINLNKRLSELGFSCQNNTLRSKKRRKKESRDQKIHITSIKRKIARLAIFPNFAYGKTSFNACYVPRMKRSGMRAQRGRGAKRRRSSKICPSN